MSHIRAAAFLAVLLLAALPARAGIDGFARQTLRVTDRVHLVYRANATDAPYEGNVEVIEQSDGLVVVDAGGSPPAGVHVVEQIRAISPKPVKYLIYTHYHGDHNLGAGAFLAAWPDVVIVSTEATRVDMTTKPMDYIKTYSTDYAGEVDYAKQQAARADIPDSVRAGWQQIVDAGDSMVAGYKDMKAYPASKTFTDKFTIPDSQTPVEVMFLGKANTDGDAVIWVPSEKVLITGDIVVNPIPYAAASFPTSWLKVFDKLEAFDFAYLVPGHGVVQTDRAYVDKVKAALIEVQRQVVPLAKKGVALDDVYIQTDFKPLVVGFCGDDKWRAQLFNSFFLHSLIKNVYFEATGQPIVQGTS
jgi:glyoxylase-like metal-dependent hydrolase (beta-lactamase superfamily II)